MIDRKQVLVQDEITLLKIHPISVEWNFHTAAKVEVDGNKATLTLNGSKISAVLLSPANAKFETANCDAPLRNDLMRGSRT